MIIVKLMGGIGNQMFQYSFARQLSLKHGVELKFDISELNSKLINEKSFIRDFELDNFNINGETASENERIGFQMNKLGKLVNLIFLYLPFNLNKLYIREPFFHFFKKALSAPENAYLDGYWQTEKYFDGIRNELLKDFTLKMELSEKSKAIANKLLKQQAVSIHVRKGDYLSMEENKSLFAVCDADYYSAALNEISKKVKEPVFYVFSDEPDWFRKNIVTSYSVDFVTHNTGSNSYQDLYLMSLCKHNIIANSSFSWWGAWLNKNSEKIVIAPKHWFKNNIKDTRDLIPGNWIQL